MEQTLTADGYLRVDPYHPFMGLNNEICRNPKHYCCCHDVWLSEEDARYRKCRCHTSANGGCERCHAFKENHYSKNINKLLRKSRQEMPCSKHPNSSYQKKRKHR